MKAKYTNSDLARDDLVEDIDFKSWAHKRDAYKGYRPEDYAEVIAHFDKMGEARQAVLRKEKAAEMYGLLRGCPAACAAMPPPAQLLAFVAVCRVTVCRICLYAVH